MNREPRQTHVKGSALVSFKLKFILFLGFNRQLRDAVFLGKSARRIQPFLPERPICQPA